MKSERTGAGDPQDSVRLLWRDRFDGQNRRGPKPAFSVDEVVDKAIDMADSDGLSAFTMRGLANAMGMTPMNIYRYVPSRSVLTDLMVDQVCAEAAVGDLRGISLEASLNAVAERNRELFVAHPWAATVNTARPAVGPGQTGKYETELAALTAWGLSDIETDAALALVIGFVRANFRDATEHQEAVVDSEVSDAEWWEANEPLLSELIGEEEFPLSTRIGRAAGEAHGSSVEHGFAYRFGLERIVAGVVELAGRNV